jgi:hypothetical protein
VAYTKYVSQRILKKGFKESNEFQPWVPSLLEKYKVLFFMFY